MATDVCELSGVECSKINGCDPSVRIPRKKEIRKKQLDPLADKFPAPDDYDEQDGQETDNPPRLW